MRALFITLPEKGHFHPLLGPARALEQRGHEVIFTAPADIERDLLQAGASQVVLPSNAPPPSGELRGERLAALLRDPERLRGWIRELLVDAAAREVEPLREVLRAVRPAAVAIDSMAYAGAIAAHLEGVPWVGLATSLNPVVPLEERSALIETTKALEPERQALFRAHGMEARFRISDVLSPRGTAVFTTAEFAPFAPLNVHRVGPSRRPHEARFDRSFALGKPLVYASFGSQAWHQPRRFEVLREACARLEVALCLATGELSQSSAPLVQCAPFVDQLGALAAAQVMVTHGGANSVMEALDAGVPLLVSPLCNDQPHNLGFVLRAGAGRGLDLDTATAAQVTDALAALLAEGPERAAAQRISRSYRAADGNAGAAALIERALC